MTWLDAIWCVVSLLTDAGPVAVLLIAVIAAGLLLLRATAADAPAETGRALLTRAARVGVPRHRDPDASGRTRPRGPTARPLAAA